VDVAAVARGVAGLTLPMARRSGSTLVVDAPPSVLLDTDPQHLRQILLNLVGNACKFTRDGAVHVEVRRADLGVRVEVRDTGIGMTDEELERVFEPFVQADGSTTRRFGGTGLGLTISRRLARELGGELVACSVPGQGSVFVLTLPAPSAGGDGGDGSSRPVR
jgi:signal transduction histidine kinase